MSVYVIRAGYLGPIKIGTSQNPQERLRQLQTASHERLILVGVVDGRQERDLHEAFKQWRLSGEWFKATPELCAVLGQVGISLTPSPPSPVASKRVTWRDYLDLVRMGLANPPQWQPEKESA